MFQDHIQVLFTAITCFGSLCVFFDLKELLWGRTFISKMHFFFLVKLETLIVLSEAYQRWALLLEGYYLSLVILFWICSAIGSTKVLSSSCWCFTWALSGFSEFGRIQQWNSVTIYLLISLGVRLVLKSEADFEPCHNHPLQCFFWTYFDTF